jgi:hypothetical protein
MQLGFTFCIMGNLVKYMLFTLALAEQGVIDFTLALDDQQDTTYHHLWFS